MLGPQGSIIWSICLLPLSFHFGISWRLAENESGKNPDEEARNLTKRKRKKHRHTSFLKQENVTRCDKAPWLMSATPSVPSQPLPQPWWKWNGSVRSWTHPRKCWGFTVFIVRIMTFYNIPSGKRLQKTMLQITMLWKNIHKFLTGLL